MKQRTRTEDYARGTVRRPERKTPMGADWGMIDADVLRGCIAAAGWAAGAVRFGYTRDGGAYAVGIYGLGEPYTEYLRPGDDIEGFLNDLKQSYDDLRAGRGLEQATGDSRGTNSGE